MTSPDLFSSARSSLNPSPVQFESLASSQSSSSLYASPYPSPILPQVVCTQVVASQYFYRENILSVKIQQTLSDGTTQNQTKCYQVRHLHFNDGSGSQDVLGFARKSQEVIKKVMSGISLLFKELDELNLQVFLQEKDVGASNEPTKKITFKPASSTSNPIISVQSGESIVHQTSVEHQPISDSFFKDPILFQLLGETKRLKESAHSLTLPAHCEEALPHLNDLSKALFLPASQLERSDENEQESGCAIDLLKEQRVLLKEQIDQLSQKIGDDRVQESLSYWHHQLLERLNTIQSQHRLQAPDDYSQEQAFNLFSDQNPEYKETYDLYKKLGAFIESISDEIKTLKLNLENVQNLLDFNEANDFVGQLEALGTGPLGEFVSQEFYKVAQNSHLMDLEDSIDSLLEKNLRALQAEKIDSIHETINRKKEEVEALLWTPISAPSFSPLLPDELEEEQEDFDSIRASSTDEEGALLDLPSYEYEDESETMSQESATEYFSNAPSISSEEVDSYFSLEEEPELESELEEIFQDP